MTVKRQSGRKTQDFNDLVYKTYGTQCYICHVELDSTNRSVDHLTPFSVDPSLEFDLDNARPCCLLHNRQKSNKVGNVRLSWINEKYLDWSVLK